jgi:hypothetical protein
LECKDAGENHNVNEEKSDMLFDLEPCSRAGRRIALDEEKTEEPWLQPVWKDNAGQFHFAKFGLLYRTFAKTLIHENVFWYVGQHDVPHWCTYVCGEYSSGIYYQDRLRHFIRNGFPTPQAGGTMEESRTLSCGRKVYRVLIFCDDLYLCPKCATYHPHTRGLPEFEWLRHDDTIDHAAIRSLIERRRAVPEFQLKPCGRSDCAETRKRTLERMKDDEDLKSRVNALDELIKREKTVKDAFPIRRPARAGFVYAIRADAYVKIGVASNVQNRILALRTGLPFDVTIINTWKHGNATYVERALHRRFKSSRCSGEWFRLREDEIQLLRQTRHIDELISDEDRAAAKL